MTTQAHGDFITSEGGFVDLQPVSSVNTTTNKVTFSIQENKGITSAFFAKRGFPLSAF
jgi:hypothetical protein